MLADELDEDFRRADQLLFERKGEVHESEFMLLSRKRMLALRPVFQSREILASLVLQNGDVSRVVEIGGRDVYFISAIARKLERLNRSRLFANRFLPEALKYRQMRVLVAVAGRQEGRQREFVFLDATNGQDFIQAFPEILANPARKRMMRCLELIRSARYDVALSELMALEMIGPDLPDLLRIRVPYNKACIYSLRALRSRGEPRKRLLRQSFQALSDWANLGIGGLWEALGFTPRNEIFRMVNDGDLRLVLKTYEKQIRRLFPRQYRSAIPTTLPRVTAISGGGGGCSPLGAEIAVFGGIERIENLRPGDHVLTIHPGTTTAELARIAHVHIRTETQLVILNEEKAFTPTQPLFSPGGIITVGSLRPGMCVYDERLRPYEIREIREHRGIFDVYEPSIEHSNHSYLSQGLLCHNKFNF